MIVTPGNRAAAVVAGLNLIVFTAIAVLSHRERKQLKRSGQVNLTSASSDSAEFNSGENEKKVASVDVEHVTPLPNH